MQESCREACYQGSCVDITCFNNSDCNDYSSYTDDICQFPGTINSICTHGNITCIQDSDCQADRYLNGLYCNGASGTDLYWDFLNFSCTNPSTIGSFCSNSITPKFQNSCPYACSNGNCVRCNNNVDCNDGRNETQDTCFFSGTLESYCANEHIECSTDEECGINGFIDGAYCSGDNIAQDYRTFTCVNKGQVGSFCRDSTSPIINQTCSFGCSEGECLPGIHDIGISLGFADSFNGIKITNLSGSPLLDPIPNLTRNKKYNIFFNLTNNGNFIENVSLSGVSGCSGISFSGSKNNFQPGDYEVKDYNNKNATCLPGLYNLTITATLLTGVDANPSDNVRKRTIRVIEGCVASAEVCDGIDNNCDGIIDNGISNITNGTNVGECQSEIRSCINGSFQIVQPSIGPSPEICDGLDNDCDGQNDENLGQTTCGLGVCEHTINNCVNGSTQVCDPFEGSSAEICDDLDNDCDGQADEGGVCPVCGNGIVEQGEECDDSNLINGDGCSSNCEKEILEDCDAKSIGYWKNHEGCSNGVGSSIWVNETQILSGSFFDVFVSINGEEICGLLAQNCASDKLCKAKQMLLADELNIVSGHLQLAAIIDGATSENSSSFINLGFLL